MGSFEQAKKAVDAGVDAIIVQGREAGGHVIGQVPIKICCSIHFRTYAASAMFLP